MPGVLNYQRSDLERILPAERLALLRLVAGAANARGLPLYLVGGFVRDLLLGSPAVDFDLVVEGDAISLAGDLAAQYGGRLTVHQPFRTAQWFAPGREHHPLDLISTRSETYQCPAALPTVRPGLLADDLLRRDFTINTLALRLDGEHWGELRDDLHGLEDLKRGLIRVLHSASFTDDPTRLFRAVRYEQRYGFQIVSETLSLIPPARALVSLLSAERIRHELDLVLEERKAVDMLSRLQDLDLLQPVHPALVHNDKTRQYFLNGARQIPECEIKYPPSFSAKTFLGWHLWLMDVETTDLEELERRLHFRADLYNSLLAASVLSATLPSHAGLRPSQWVARLEKIPLTAVHAVFMITPDGEMRQNLFNYLQTWRFVKPRTNGHDLTNRGLTPGPRYQQILQRLRDAWLDGEVETRNEELELLDGLISIQFPS